MYGYLPRRIKCSVNGNGDGTWPDIAWGGDCTGTAATTNITLAGNSACTLTCTPGGDDDDDDDDDDNNDDNDDNNDDNSGAGTCGNEGTLAVDCNQGQEIIRWKN